jgi:hypothetical protein
MTNEKIDACRQAYDAWCLSKVTENKLSWIGTTWDAWKAAWNARPQAQSGDAAKALDSFLEYIDKFEVDGEFVRSHTKTIRAALSQAQQCDKVKLLEKENAYLREALKNQLDKELARDKTIVKE